MSLTPNHYMNLESDSTDRGFGAAIGKPTPAGYVQGMAITAGAAGSASLTGNKFNYKDASDTNISNVWFRRTYSCWATTNSFSNNFSIYSEGGSVRNMTIMFGLGGVPVYIADNDSDNDPGCPWSQAVVGPKLKLNTPYHMGYVWESDRTDTGPEGKGRTYIRCYLNGRMIGEKEIYKWDTGANEEILDEPGGQLNAHSGDIEIGGARNIIVSKKTFTTGALTGLVADVCWWDGELLDDATMWELFKRGATDTTSTVTFTGLSDGTEIRLFDSQSPYGEIGVGVENTVAPSVTVDYTVASTVDVRLVIIAPGKRIFSEVITLPREDSEINAGLLLQDDLAYRND